MTLPADHNLKDLIKRGDLRLLLLGFLLVVGMVILSGSVVMNFERERNKDEVVRANLETIETQVRISSSAGDAHDCRTGLFTEPTIAAALEAIGVANNHTTVTCAATAEFFTVVAARPTLGFFTPSSSFWCADSVQPVCSTNHQPDVGSLCSCTSSH